jgi:hypothetical protein
MSGNARAMRATAAARKKRRHRWDYRAAAARLLRSVMGSLRRAIALEVFYINRREVRILDVSKVQEADSYTVENVTPERFSQLLANPALDLTPEFLRRAKSRGDICFGAFRDGELVAYCWFGTGAPEPFNAHFDVVYDYPGQTYAYSALTVPSFRGRCLQLLIAAHANRELGARCFSHVVGYSNIENSMSRRMVAKLGNSPVVGWAMCARIAGQSIKFISPGGRRWGFDLIARD